MRALIIIILTVITLSAIADEDFVNSVLEALGEQPQTQQQIDDDFDRFGPRPQNGDGPPIQSCPREDALAGRC